MGITLTWLGAIAGDQGDFAHALPWLEEGLTLAREVGNPQELGFALYLFGQTLHRRGDLARARALLEESVAVYRNGGLMAGLWAQALAYLGGVDEDLGDAAQAGAIYREALSELWVRIEDRGNVAFLMEGLASLAAKAGQSVRALQLIGCAERLREEIGGPAGVFGQRRDVQTQELARRTLAPEAAEAALAVGRVMALPEAVAYALGDAPPP